ncbi:Mov34/MPN/PAD-1 family protein [Cohnella suwonensis]|uniref:Mov34/MPN/PAD-1 family protein n=1 Tax=Cohnella suwonensis TaxID=696072 RepID=A0ABW0LYN0_9BACL
MIVRLSEELENDLISAALARLPLECCGVVYGTATDDAIVADAFGLVRNAAISPERRFAFHPEDWVSVIFEAQKNQREIVGFFHSHPEESVLPSQRDMNGSLPWRTYWIVGVSPAERGIAVYHRHHADDRWDPLRISRE